MTWVRIDDVEQACQLREAGLLWRYIPNYDPPHSPIDGDWWPAHEIRNLWQGATGFGAHFCILTED